MQRGGTVVSDQAWRRWGVVLAVVVVLCSVPIVINVWPARAAAIDPDTLRQRIAASAGRSYQGFAQSAGLLPLPSLPNLEQVTDLVSTTNEMRVWYAGPDRWRVDVVDGAGERDVYQTPGAQYVWDSGDTTLTEIVGEQPVRLPRAADLTPPELVRRVLDIAQGDRLQPLPGRRVAGIGAAGLRIVPATADTTVDHVDIWADPGSGLPVQAEVTAKGGQRPVFRTRFLELELVTPDAGVVTPPAHHAGMNHRTTAALDVLGEINRRRPAVLPGDLAGSPRRDAIAGLSAAGVYGTGLAQYVVVALPGRFGREAYDRIETFGADIDVPSGAAAMIGTGLLTVLVVRADRTYLVAGLVQPDLMKRVAVDLSGAVS
jgi:hypothetical protein